MNESGKKFDWVLLLSLVVIVGGIIFLLFMGNKFGIFDNFFNKKPVYNNQNLSALETKYCAYAKKTLDWVDKKRTLSGKYGFYVVCNKEKKECNKLIETGPNGYNDLPILWSRYKYFLKTQDMEQLSIVKRDIGIHFNQPELSLIKNIFWNCRFLTEMRDEKILGPDYVSKIDKICHTGKYLDTENVVTNKDGKKNVLNLSNFDWGKSIDKDLSSFKQDTIINGKHSLYVTYPSDFVARYKIWNNKNDLDLANAYFNKLMIEYKINYNKFLPQDRCLMAVSALDLFSVNKDKEYFNLAMGIYDNYFGENEIFTKAKIPECAFLARELSKYDNSRDYKFSQNKLLDFFIENYWDGDQGKNKISGESGFFESTKGSYLNKSLEGNALIVNLLCQ